jgi:hypothetical protein
VTETATTMPSTGSDWRALLGDPTTAADTLVALAKDPAADVEALAAVAADPALLRRAPALVGALYRNPRTPTATAHRAIVSAGQMGITCDDFPELAELAAVVAADPAALEPALADAGVAAVLQATRDAEGDGDSEAVAETAGGQGAGGPGAAAAPGPGKRKSATIDFTKLKLFEKIRLATLGNAYCRQNLLRDANRMVALAAIRSPQLTDGEVVKAAGNRALSEDVIRYIANRKEMVKQYAVKAALVGNAKCPLGIALRLLPSLHGEDIKALARSKNIPAALSAAAKKLAAARGPQ